MAVNYSSYILVPIFHEGFVDLIVLCLFVTDPFDRDGVETVNLGPRTCQQDRRVGGDNKLRVPCLAHLLEEVQQRQLALWRKCRLRLV